MNIQPVFTRYDINRKLPFDWSSPIVVDHVEDFDTRFIEVYVYESITNKQVDLNGTTIIARIVAALSTEKILLNDNVACTLNGSGNIIIPIDGAVIETLASTLLIEVRITQDAQALVLPFPLYVQMRGSILDDTGIAPESRGTIPELLEAAQEALDAAAAALEDAGDYSKLDNKPQINGHTLSGNKTSSELGLQDKLTAGKNVTIDESGVISAEGGTDDYNDLENKPQISGVTLSGDKTPDELGLQKKLTIQSSGSDPNEYLFLRNNGYLGLNSQFVLSIQSSGFPKLSYWSSVNGVASITTSSIVSDGLTVGINGNIPVSEDGTYYRFCTNGETRKEIYLTNSGKAYQKLTTLPGGTWVEGQWQEIGGGSKIASGVVNQNGTISFYDADGNLLFTTSGASVIGFSPIATVTQTASGATVSITDKNGTTTANISNGAPGQDYVLTPQDKTDIANIVLGELPTTQGVLYGNTSN